MRRFQFVCFVLLLSVRAYGDNKPKELITLAKQAVVMDATTGFVIAQKQCQQKMSPSSMTKIMTVFLTFELCSKSSCT